MPPPPVAGAPDDVTALPEELVPEELEELVPEAPEEDVAAAQSAPIAFASAVSFAMSTVPLAAAFSSVVNAVTAWVTEADPEAAA